MWKRGYCRNEIVYIKNGIWEQNKDNRKRDAGNRITKKLWRIQKKFIKQKIINMGWETVVLQPKPRKENIKTINGELRI